MTKAQAKKFNNAVKRVLPAKFLGGSTLKGYGFLYDAAVNRCIATDGNCLVSVAPEVLGYIGLVAQPDLKTPENQNRFYVVGEHGMKPFQNPPSWLYNWERVVPSTDGKGHHPVDLRFGGIDIGYLLARKDKYVKHRYIDILPPLAYKVFVPEDTRTAVKIESEDGSVVFAIAQVYVGAVSGYDIDPILSKV